MRMECNCGYKGFTEQINATCPACHDEMLPARIIDFEEFRPVLDRIMAKIKISTITHGDWSQYSVDDVFSSVSDEYYDSYMSAYTIDSITGPHGQIDKLEDMAVAAIKGIVRLMCIQQAKQ